MNFKANLLKKARFLAGCGLLLLFSGCERDDPNALVPTFPLEGEVVAFKAPQFEWAAKKKGTVHFELLLEGDVVFEDILNGSSIEPDLHLIPGVEYTWRLTQDERTFSIPFQVEPLSSILSNLVFTGSFSFRETTPNRTINESGIGTATFGIVGTTAGISTEWINSPMVTLGITDSLFTMGHGQDFEFTAVVNYLRNTLVCNMHRFEPYHEEWYSFESF
jgi:hypothetical protein